MIFKIARYLADLDQWEKQKRWEDTFGKKPGSLEIKRPDSGDYVELECGVEWRHD